MPNESKIQDERFWWKWLKSGAVLDGGVSLGNGHADKWLRQAVGYRWCGKPRSADVLIIRAKHIVGAYGAQIHIPCLHEVQGLPGTITVSDYHPLEPDKLKDLLDLASKAPYEIVNQVQIRLIQGIWGMTDPRPITGRVADKERELNSLFMARYKEGDTAELVSKFVRIMEM